MLGRLRGAKPLFLFNSPFREKFLNPNIEILNGYELRCLVFWISCFEFLMRGGVKYRSGLDRASLSLYNVGTNYCTPPCTWQGLI